MFVGRKTEISNMCFYVCVAKGYLTQAVAVSVVLLGSCRAVFVIPTTQAKSR